jgi:hypothetical protein
MKWLSLAICSLGVWVFLGSFVDGDWHSYVFGAIAAVLALIAAYTITE